MPITCIAYPNIPGQMPYSYMPVQMASYPQYMSYPPPNFPEKPQNLDEVPSTPSRSPAPVPKEEMDTSEEIKELPEDKNILKPDMPKQRWKREDDKRMFQFLREFCSKYGETIERIHFRLKDAPHEQLSFWSKVAHKMNWKGPVSTLRQRFLKLKSMKGLSVREDMLLRKLYAKKKKDPSITWDSILYHFPGRSLRTLQLTNLEGNSSYEDPPLEIHEDDASTIHSAHYKVFKITKVAKENVSESSSMDESNKIRIAIDGSSIFPRSHHSPQVRKKSSPKSQELVIID